jgi:hypothetical protein
MNKLTWTQWLTDSHPADVYLIVNVQATPSPINTLYAGDCIDEAFRLYDSTPLAHIADVGFWLVRLKTAACRELGKLMDNGVFSDPSWGWAYRSQMSLQENLDHWRRRQIVTLDGEPVVLRLGDSRIASVLLPAMNRDDWRLLMTPVQEVLTDTPELRVFTSPVTDAPLPDPEIQQLPFEMKPHLMRAWQTSAQAMLCCTENIVCDLWEDHPETALLLDTPEGMLKQRITGWLTEETEKLTDPGSLTEADFRRYAAHQGWTAVSEETK